MNTLSNHRAERLELWIKTHYNGVQAKFINKFDLNQGEISRMLLKKRVIGEKKARILEEQTDIPKMWLDDTGEEEAPASNARRAGFSVDVANDEDEDYYEISYYYAKGSCGGGLVNPEDMVKGKLRKERSWFRDFEVEAKNLVTVYADGDSMANYIEHGDMVIFDTSRTDPIDGEIFLIKHVDSERIKKLRREIDGTWVLESLNTDKRKYPDERITPEKAEFLKIVGTFVYRQGGNKRR